MDLGGLKEFAASLPQRQVMPVTIFDPHGNAIATKARSHIGHPEADKKIHSAQMRNNYISFHRSSSSRRTGEAQSRNIQRLLKKSVVTPGQRDAGPYNTYFPDENLKKAIEHYYWRIVTRACKRCQWHSADSEVAGLLAQH